MCECNAQYDWMGTNGEDAHLRRHRRSRCMTIHGMWPSGSTTCSLTARVWHVRRVHRVGHHRRVNYLLCTKHATWRQASHICNNYGLCRGKHVGYGISVCRLPALQQWYVKFDVGASNHESLKLCNAIFHLQIFLDTEMVIFTTKTKHVCDHHVAIALMTCRPANPNPAFPEP